MYDVYWHKYLVKYVQYDDSACSVLAAKHPLLFAGVHWTSLAAGRTTSPQALGWTAFPWQQGSTLDYPCQRGSSGICIPNIAGDNPCDIGPSLPWTLDFNVGVTILGGVVHHALAKYLRVAEH